MSDDLRERIADALLDGPPIAMTVAEANATADALLPLVQAEKAEAWADGYSYCDPHGAIKANPYAAGEAGKP